MQPDARFLMAYCERLGSPAFWAEPLNALTNLGFLIAAALAFRHWRRAGGRDRLVLALIGTLAAIGVGSFLFHTLPNGVTVLMDVLPIQAFVLLYLGLAIRRFLGAPVWVAFAGPAAFFAGAFALVEAAGPRALGGGIGYVPALLALYGFGLALAIRGKGAMGLAPGAADRALAARPGLWGDDARRAARGLLLAALMFTLSLTLRTLDLPLCGLWPAGLHFAWHGINAAVLGVLVGVGSAKT